jgi:hypothetical protein
MFFASERRWKTGCFRLGFLSVSACDTLGMRRFAPLFLVC